MYADTQTNVYTTSIVFSFVNHIVHELDAKCDGFIHSFLYVILPLCKNYRPKNLPQLHAEKLEIFKV